MHHKIPLAKLLRFLHLTFHLLLNFQATFLFFFISFLASCDFCLLLIIFANSMDPDQDRQNVGPDLDLHRLKRIFPNIQIIQCLRCSQCQIRALGSACMLLKADHYRPASETPFKWRFAGGPIVTRDCLLAGVWGSLISLTVFFCLNLLGHRLAITCAYTLCRYDARPVVATN